MDTTQATEANTTFIKQVMEFFKTSSYGVLEIIIIAVFGILIIKLLMKLIKQALLASSIDRSLVAFIDAVIEFVLALMLVLYCLNRMSVNVTGIVTMVSALGLSIGLALQDLIGGVANGLVIINTKPFKVDDYVTIGSQSGTVREISMLHTTLVTVDNKKIILTNKSVYNSEITNYSAFTNRRLDMNFDIDYSADLDEARKIIRKVVEDHSLALKNPAPFVRLSDDADNALVITLRVWVKAENYWDLFFDLKEQVISALVKAGINAPYPQLTVGFRGDDPVVKKASAAMSAASREEKK
ncbi:MAG: mechanosensitive ion channel family protein [Sphaerochaetaceae bacterium]|nr:mechanosensitive ion channel family protein [Sphaerochaetaceae bacterium]